MVFAWKITYEPLILNSFVSGFIVRLYLSMRDLSSCLTCFSSTHRTTVVTAITPSEASTRRDDAGAALCTYSHRKLVNHPLSFHQETTSKSAGLPACLIGRCCSCFLVSVLGLYLFLFLACTCSFVLLLRIFASSESRSPPPVLVLALVLVVLVVLAVLVVYYYHYHYYYYYFYYYYYYYYYYYFYYY